ncbi:uncharacterized protein CANTADRAFT_20736 [Suhomyces tanzawaensis NRRL Y-17324]|uniref:Uncharacterized protein n=1 Tax=Suhomyces tanzawaensis NRRL Y-17324 TaxID=984487 RepID=A0A1E4SNV1_9ASCO|nr:uncharacterized protein CANTADRAFT_20736 [Suhomyces tanzawaensis NRRL Y-17324]ODV81201.1 hypothetical protein CANTADRAFT_20736 [Suhomyces tanzawaensis NRRL Y-17324]
MATAAPVFRIVSMKSGTPFQYQNIVLKDGQIYISGQDSPINFLLNDDKTLIDATNNRFIQIHENEVEETSSKSLATKGFALKDGYLTLGDKTFYACANGDSYKLTTHCESGDSIALKITEQTNSN